MKFEVTILGSSSATPVFNRNPSAQILNCNENLYLIDCGEGTQQQLIKNGFKASKIDHIFISHLHGDHYFGLIGLLSTMHLNGRTKPIHVYGPEALLDILNIQFKHSDTVLRYTLTFHAIDATCNTELLNIKEMRVEAFPLNHRIPCTGFKFIKKQNALKLNTQALEEDAVPLELYSMLKRGVDVELLDGKVLSYKRYTSPGLPEKIYSYCSDTIFEESYFKYVSQSDLLYHEATFLDELTERAKQTYHSTALEAAVVARQTSAKKLIIGHFSSRYKNLVPLLQEAKAEFENTELALEGKTFTI